MSDNNTWEPSEDVDPRDVIKMTENGDVLLGSGFQSEEVLRSTETDKDE